MSASEVRAAVELAFRDFSIDGVASSGRHEPVKSEIRRALGSLLATTLSSIGAGILRYETKAAMDADNDQADGQLAYVWGDATAANNKVYQNDSDTWVEAAWYFTAVAGVVQPLVDDAEAARDMAVSLLQPFTMLEQAMREDGVILYTSAVTNTTTWGIAAEFGGVGFSINGTDLVDGNPDLTIGSVKGYIQVGTGTTYVVAKLYRRLVAQASSYPGAAASDTILETLTVPIGELGLTAAGPMREVQFDFPPAAVDDDYAYVFTVEAFDDANDPTVVGFGQGPLPGGSPSHYAGFYRTTAGGGWTPVVGACAPATWLYATYVDIKALKDRVQETENRLTKVDLSFDEQFTALGSREGDGSYWPASDAHFRWLFGAEVGDDIAASKTMSHVSVTVQLSTSITKLQLRIWQRPTDDATDDDFPGTGPDDEGIFIDTLTLEELGLTPTGGDLQECIFPFDPITTEAGTTYIFDLTAYDDANVTQGFGITRNMNVASASQQQRGFFDAAGAIASPIALAWRAGYLVYVLPAASSDAGLDTRDRIDAATATADGFDVDVSGTFSRAGTPSSFSGSVTLATPTTGDVVDEARTLTDTPIGVPHKYYNPLGVLAHSNVSSVVVKDATTNAVLVLGTDYLLEPTVGVVSRATTGTNRPVKVSYHWSKVRYDLVCVHAETKAISAVAGTPRDTDAGEFIPARSSSALITLFHARVADGFDVELIPVWYLDGNIHRDLIAARNADYERQRRALAPILAMARRGETIRVTFMGDSIGAQEGGYAPTAQANGEFRDRTAYFLFNIGSDRVDDLPLYDQGDGAGAVHTRQSTPWKLCDALTALGATVEYYNFCIGGTASGAGSRNGADPVLRAAAWATNPHIFGTHYGMNETGSDDTEGNLVDLFQEAIDEGALAVFAIGQPRPSNRKPHSMEAVRKTWRATRRAAEFFPNGAYIGPERLVDDDYIGGMGVSTKELGSADAYHHPGIREADVTGAEIRAMICGE